MPSSSHLTPEAMPFLPAIAALPTLPDAALTCTLDMLFEPSADLHALALPTMRTLSFESYGDLIGTLRDQLLTIATAIDTDNDADADARKPLHSILASHPRLGEPKIATLSAQSAAEQAKLQGGDANEAGMLAALNREYEARFPGLRYVVFVNGRSRGIVMEDMRRRIDRGDFQAEEKEAIEVGTAHQMRGLHRALLRFPFLLCIRS
jgi:2-oxo-4-hydroxy-4-carboxy--5-ureidoimidazoline (OHCU) decarboxylase